MSTREETAAYERAAEVGQRASRRRRAVHVTPCHVARVGSVMSARYAEVGSAGEQCLPERTRCIELDLAWLHAHDGLVITVTWPRARDLDESVVVTLHAPEGDVVYRSYRYDWLPQRLHLRRVGTPGDGAVET